MSEAHATPPVPWFSFRGKAYAGSRPGFFEPRDFAWTTETEKRFAAVLAADATYLAQFSKTADPYFNQSLVSKKGGWQQSAFYFWGKKNEAACNAAPALDTFVRSIPGMLSAGLSLLNPDTKILPHYGDTDAVIRCHIGIDIPAGLPECGIKVNGESRAWEKGKWLLFCDAHRHEAWNLTDKMRLVLIVDVLLPEFVSQKNSICADVRSMLSVQKADERFPLFRKFPGALRGIVRRYFRRKHLKESGPGR